MKHHKGNGFRVIVVDDDREMRNSLSHLLTRANWQVETLGRGEDVAARLREFRPEVVLSDVRMPGMSGLELLSSLGHEDVPPIVLISAHGDIPTAVKAMQDGAYSFLEKPFDPNRLLTVLVHAAQQFRQQMETGRLKARLANLSGLDRILLGECPSIVALRQEVFDLANSDAPVMVEGETGTGKELVARALHDLSAHAGGPFVAINCASIPLEHFEAFMFGTAGGVRGVLASADSGTLFLDEVAACPLPLQAKLLRAIETQEFTMLGASGPTKVKMRLVSASNEHLDTAIEQGRFRQDLFFRLNTLELTLPPLRERREDIVLLYAHFLSQQAELYEISAPEPSAEDIAALMSHDWPGNVRELRHVAERRILAARRGSGSVAAAIRRDDDLDEVPETLRLAIAAFEKQLISQAIRTHLGRMDAVAEALGIGRRTLNEKIVKLGLNKAELL
ncbi:C4-dicarboxylate transport transcriptional regulatory protein DctD [hydrothermal vent metagenome]|uniref:C4-dicarboxylate transport transcriptional regulatory protein DctD n=1 Tax=hydrothermal vent metagenome TaxID=652676 RepID=A0A3B0TJG9_9ZZZZ